MAHTIGGPAGDPRTVGRCLRWRFDVEPTVPDDEFRVRALGSLLDVDLPISQPLSAATEAGSASTRRPQCSTRRWQRQHVGVPSGRGGSRSESSMPPPAAAPRLLPLPPRRAAARSGLLLGQDKSYTDDDNDGWACHPPRRSKLYRTIARQASHCRWQHIIEGPSGECMRAGCCRFPPV